MFFQIGIGALTPITDPDYRLFQIGIGALTPIICRESCDDFEGTVIQDTDGVRPDRVFFEQEKMTD